jgi:hypothetical protein
MRRQLHDNFCETAWETVLIKGFKDEFHVDGRYFKTPAAPREQSMEGRKGEFLHDKNMIR